MLGMMLAFRRTGARMLFGWGYGVFLWGSAAGHLYQWFVRGDHQAGNTGGILIYDTAIPIVVIALAAASQRGTKKSALLEPA